MRFTKRVYTRINTTGAQHKGLIPNLVFVNDGQSERPGVLTRERREIVQIGNERRTTRDGRVIRYCNMFSGC